VVLLGPTAVGKTRVAEHLAVALDGEIIGVDSMQVYRGLDAGTAKPSAESLRRVRYHLVDVADVTVDFSLGDFVRAAEEAVAGVRARGRVPILAGGTGMYLRGFLKGLDPAPPRDPVLRDRLVKLADRRGPSHLHRILALHDHGGSKYLGKREITRTSDDLHPPIAEHQAPTSWTGRSRPKRSSGSTGG